MYLVSREVLATSIERAIHTKGKVYEIRMAKDEFQPQPKKGKPGFNGRKS